MFKVNNTSYIFHHSFILPHIELYFARLRDRREVWRAENFCISLLQPRYQLKILGTFINQGRYLVPRPNSTSFVQSLGYLLSYLLQDSRDSNTIKHNNSSSFSFSDIINISRLYLWYYKCYKILSCINFFSNHVSVMLYLLLLHFLMRSHVYQQAYIPAILPLKQLFYF